MGGLREMAAPFVALGPSGVAIRDRLKHLTTEDEKVLRLVGDLLGTLACRDLKARCADGLDHDTEQWAERKRMLTGESSSRWAGSITKASHDQWALARRGHLAHIHSLEAGIDTITHRLSLPIGQKGSKKAPGGYRSRREWHAKSRRLHVLADRLDAVRADWQAGVVRVVRGGKRLLNTRHHLQAARLTEERWRARWQAERRFLAADGESGKRFGNETIRLTPDGEVSIKLPAPLAHLANAPYGRYVLAAKVSFAHRGEQWADRVAANRAVAYRIHEDTARGRWYLTASWTNPPVKTVPLEAARANGLVGVDTNADLPHRRMAARRARQPVRQAPPVLLRPRRPGRPPGRAGAARTHPAPALGCPARPRDRDRRPRLRSGEDPREARTAQAVPQADLRHAREQAAVKARVDGGRAGHHRGRGRPGIHLDLGRPALAEAPH